MSFSVLPEPTPAEPTPQWDTIAAAAEHFKLSQDTIRRMISRGEIEARRFGPRLIRVNFASIIQNARPLQYAGGGH